MKKKKPNIYGINQLELFSNMIDDLLDNSEEQYNSISPALDKPHVLDDYTIERIYKVVGESKEFIPYYKNQLNLWLRQKITIAQLKEVKRLQLQLKKTEKLIDKILSMTDKLKHNTIEKVLAKDDAELGLEFLLEKMNNGKK
jgi:hypothetical protein